MKQFPGSLLAIEYHLPEKVISNKYFQDNFPEWKVDLTEKKTGVLERRISRDDETAYDLSLHAVKKLLNNNPILHDKIDAIIYCTQSPDYIMPSNAFLMQRDLKLKNNILAFDYNLACSGYIFGLLMASSFIKLGIAKNILLITADTYSKYLDKEDRSTRMLFGDGASASWISDNVEDGQTPLIKSFRDFQCASDGQGWDKFIIKSGGNREPFNINNDISQNKIYMNGLHVLNFVNDRVVKQITELLKKNNLEILDIDQFFLHQASLLAIQSIEQKLKIHPNKIFSNLENTGNTVSSSIPILIKDFFSKNTMPADSKILLCGFGVGYSWATLIAEK